MQLAPSPAEPPAQKPRRRHRATRAQLLTRAAIDGRSNAAKAFDRLAAEIHQDLGGQDQLSAIERALVEAFCAAAITLEDLNARLLLGQQIDLGEHCAAISAMVRVASRLGLRRVPRDVTPTLGDVLRENLRRQQEEQQP